MRQEYKILVGNPQGKTLLGRTKPRWKNLSEIEREDV